MLPAFKPEWDARKRLTSDTSAPLPLEHRHTVRRPDVIFADTKLKGVFIIELERRTDERGSGLPMATRCSKTRPTRATRRGACYTPGAEGGLPHDDERGAPWSILAAAGDVISAKDRNFRPLDEIKSELRRRMVSQRAASGRLAGAARPDHGGDGLQ